MQTIGASIASATTGALAIVSFLVPVSPAFSIQLGPKRVLSTTGSDRATRYVQSNKTVTLHDISHVTWLDSNFASKVTSFNSSTQLWSNTKTIGTGYDNHGGPAIAVDGDGYLHAIFGPHVGP